MRFHSFAGPGPAYRSFFFLKLSSSLRGYLLFYHIQYEIPSKRSYSYPFVLFISHFPPNQFVPARLPPVSVALHLYRFCPHFRHLRLLRRPSPRKKVSAVPNAAFLTSSCSMSVPAPCMCTGISTILGSGGLFAAAVINGFYLVGEK